MKKFSLFSAFIAGMLMVSCSDSTMESNAGLGNSKTSDGYIALDINLPTRSGGHTRAVSYADGLGNEYEVKNAKLLLFRGEPNAAEATVTYRGTYNLIGMNWETNDNTQITTSSIGVAKVNGIDTSKDYYALVVLNENGQIPALTETSTLATLNASALTNKNESNFTKAGFFMCNAPLANANGGTKPTVTTLVKIDNNQIKSTESEAKSTPAATVYVERAVGKVTLNTSTDLDANHNTNITKYTIQSWALDNKNTKTYLVRNVAGNESASPAINGIAKWYNYTAKPSDYRFVDKNPVEAGAGYRIHWGVDPNYNATITPGELKAATDADFKTVFGNDNPLYCLENTFDVERMQWGNTTRAIVKANLTVTGAESDGSFYIIDDANNTIYNKTSAASKIAKAAESWFNTNSSTYLSSGTITWSVTMDEPTNGGYVTNVTNVDITESGVTYAGSYKKKDVEDAIKDEINNNILAGVNPMKVAYYKGGASYYQIRIKHFGDDETPWNVVTDGGYLGTGDAREAKWLGRYGVLRNTWYDLTVTGLKEIGYPEIPSGEADKWDDVADKYLSVKINILSWAKRTQDAVLGDK